MTYGDLRSKFVDANQNSPAKIEINIPAYQLNPTCPRL